MSLDPPPRNTQRQLFVTLLVGQRFRCLSLEDVFASEGNIYGKDFMAKPCDEPVFAVAGVITSDGDVRSLLDLSNEDWEALRRDYEQLVSDVDTPAIRLEETHNVLFIRHIDSGLVVRVLFHIGIGARTENDAAKCIDVSQLTKAEWVVISDGLARR